MSIDILVEVGQATCTWVQNSFHAIWTNLLHPYFPLPSQGVVWWPHSTSCRPLYSAVALATRTLLCPQMSLLDLEQETTAPHESDSRYTTASFPVSSFWSLAGFKNGGGRPGPFYKWHQCLQRGEVSPLDLRPNQTKNTCANCVLSIGTPPYFCIHVIKRTRPSSVCFFILQGIKNWTAWEWGVQWILISKEG